MTRPRLRELPWTAPLAVFRAAQELDPAGLVWLDSGGAPEPPARWSVLAIAPLEVLEMRVGAGRLASASPDPFAALEDLHRRWRDHFGLGITTSADSGGDDLPPFTGGVIALVGYDAGRALERLPAIAADDPALPDLWAAVYDSALVFDRAKERLYITSWDEHSLTERTLERMANAAHSQIQPKVEAAPARGIQPSAEVKGACTGWDDRPLDACHDRGPDRTYDSVNDRVRFLSGVERIRDEIARGEIYQANLTRRVVRTVPLSEAPFLYERLRAGSPTPFGAYVDAGAFRLLSASPERFLRIAGGWAETRPIKGTRPRGRSPAEDAALRAELLASAKDAAELLMIVDLERNDLGRVCETGSVEVLDFPRVEGYSTVWHLVATVRARLAPEVSPAAVLRAAFPGGSITGAPKQRAMEILEEIEPARRKFSMGSLVAWDFGGALDSSLLIRTMTMRGGEALLDVGAGIVADSSPEAEFLETLAKAAPLVGALEGS